MKGPKKPVVDSLLLEYLDATFPDKCPDPKATDREVWMAVGTRQVVENLRAVSKAQLKENLQSVRVKQ